MNPIGASILVILIAVVLFAPRRWALLAMMAGILYLPMGLNIEMLGLNLYPMRFLEIAGFARVVKKNEFSFKKLNRIDIALLLLYIYTTLIFLIRSTEIFGYQIGLLVDPMLCYFAFRGMVGDIKEFKWLLRALVVVLVPFVFLVVVERLTGQNGFVFLGGVEKSSFFIRGGKPRCFASFQNPSLLGTVGAVLLPLYIGLAFDKAERAMALLAMVLCLAIVWASNSGGPALGTAFALLGWFFWKKRTVMRKVRWGIVALLVSLQIVMKAPIWYLMARLSSISGGDGWHRSYLIEMAVQHMGEWWLMGMPISDTIDWFPDMLEATGGADITNQFVAFGLRGGVGAIILFVVLLTRAFSILGRALWQVRAASFESEKLEFLMWGLGVMLSVHIVNWFGITYFDQTYALWFMQLAALNNLSEQCLKAPPAEEPQGRFVEARNRQTDIRTSPGVSELHS
jgi:hypothetical protein